MTRFSPVLALAPPWHAELRALARGERVAARSSDSPDRLPFEVFSGVAVLRCLGFIVQKSSWFTAAGFASSTDALGALITAAVKSDAVRCVLMEIDSPGGTTYGVGELSDRIYGLRASGKTVTAVANSMAASAAFWIGSAADRLLVTPGGDVGSVGVWTAHVDESAALDDAGLKVTLISAGPKKTDANPFEPLSDSAKADMQARVDSIYSAFVGTVARNRHTSPADVRENYGQGGLVRAADALKSRMVDGIATFQDAFRSLSVSGDPGRSMTAAESRTANEIMASAGLAPATVAKSAPADDFDDSYFFGSAPRRGTGHGDPNETYRRRLSLIEKQIAWDN